MQEGWEACQPTANCWQKRLQAERRWLFRQVHGAGIDGEPALCRDLQVMAMPWDWQ